MFLTCAPISEFSEYHVYLSFVIYSFSILRNVFGQCSIRRCCDAVLLFCYTSLLPRKTIHILTYIIDPYCLMLSQVKTVFERIQRVTFQADLKVTVCPRSLGPVIIVSYNIKWVKSSWTYSK